MRTHTLALLLLTLAGSPGFAQQWAQEMFDRTSHNFGTVARGAKVEQTFTVENIYEEDARVSSVRSSCGCTTATYPKGILKTWDKGKIVVQVDTRGFFGQKDATLTVVLDKPFPAEVQLHVHTYIRRDVVVQPGAVEFGTVYQGTSRLEKVTVDYAGRTNWQILKVESANPHLQAQVVETSRGMGQATYDLRVTLKKSAPAGYIRDHVVLVTNDRNPRASRVPVAVEGIVIPAVTARPSPLSGVVVETGKTVTERLIVQGKMPFQIVSAVSSDPRFQCTVLPRTKTLYVVQVAFTAGQTPGKVSSKIRIQTDLAGTVLEVPVEVRVMPRGPVSF